MATIKEYASIHSSKVANTIMYLQNKDTDLRLHNNAEITLENAHTLKIP